ncbi:hypothetical protein DSO57_1032389 [Entomophthora muscae]|uniref:Uncharacterized protein n=1 Tax=Entomophthora muscae TaxID=34485 RepID=A0ACC2S2I1_9FUNG|nr:hypothetical protein DSO57_1032389 [Entomophthora muscae]
MAGSWNPIPLSLVGLSATCNLVVILLTLLFGFRRQLLVQRVSIKLQVLICFADLAKNVLFFMSHADGDDGFCSALGFLSLIAGHICVLLILSLAVNAHWVLICNFPHKKWWFMCYWLTPCILATLFNLPLWRWAAFGENTDGVCFIKKGYRTLELIYVYGLYTAVGIYCLIVSVFVLTKVRRNPNALLSLRKNIDPTGLRNKELIIKNVAKLMSTSVTFLLALCISVAFADVCLAIDYFTDSFNPVLLSWGNFGFNTIGLLNFFAFIADPLVRRALTNPPSSRDTIQEYPIESMSPGQKFLQSVCDSETEDASAPDKIFIKEFINAT